MVDHFVNAADDEGCGLTEIARLLVNTINSTAKIQETLFKPEPEISTYIVYADGFFGRPLIPAEVWVLRPPKRRQRIELLQKLPETMKRFVSSFMIDEFQKGGEQHESND